MIRLKELEAEVKKCKRLLAQAKEEIVSHRQKRKHRQAFAESVQSPHLSDDDFEGLNLSFGAYSPNSSLASFLGKDLSPRSPAF